MSLIDQGGRFQTVRTPEESLTLLKEDIHLLSEEEKEVLNLAIEDFKTAGKSPIIDYASRLLYRTPPVSMETFLDDPYFCGKLTRNLFPLLRKDLIHIFSNYYTIVVYGGSIGAGKSTFARLALLRMIYEVSCLNDPLETYGVSSSDRIAFPVISVTEDQANELVFEKMKNALEEIPYFAQEFKPIHSTQKTGILFQHGIWIPPGMSTERRSIGINAFGGIIEEVNFFRQLRNTNPNQNNPDIAEAIFKSITRRMQSRFLVKGKLPGQLIIISSKTSVNSFTERRIKEAASNPTIFVREAAVYEMAPDRYSGSKFRVAIGNETKQSRILFDNEPDPEGMKVIQVPVEFREAFETDIESSLREIAGFATVSITPYMSRRDKIQECIDDTRLHPFSEYVWVQDIQGNIQWDKIARQKKDGSWEPLYHPKSPRFASLDLSKNGDATGVCIGCMGPFVNVKRVGKEDSEMVPSYHVDLLLRIEAPIGGEIIQSEIRKLIYDFTSHGFYIKEISADKFQSLSTLQTFRQQGYQTKIVSVDESSGPYELLKLAIYENRINYYRYDPLLKELRELQKNWKNGKIDHPHPSDVKGASKDVSDALAQCCVLITGSAVQTFTDEPIQVQTMMEDENDESWVIGGHVQVPEKKAPNQEDWRTHADERLKSMQNQQKQEDWKKNFQMPFLMG